MRSIKTGVLFLVLIAAGILLMACKVITPEPEPKAVRFINLTADGSSTAPTTKLTLTFQSDIAGLTADDITMDAGTTGAVKGALTRTAGGVYSLAMSGITQSGAVTAAVAKSGYDISDATKTVTVYPQVTVAFTGLTADGSGSAATTKLTLTFDKNIVGLTASDITFNAGSAGVVKGALTQAAGTGVYNLAVSFNTTTGGSVTVSVAEKPGYTITGGSKSVTVYPPVGTAVTGVWRELTVTEGTTALRYDDLKGKKDVLYVTPGASSNEYWAVLAYDLAEYAGKQVKITVSVDAWMETAGKVAWQVNNNGSYPTIAGSTSTPLSAGQWHTVSGSNTVTIASGGATLYLSAQQIAGNKAYLANFTVTIDDGSADANDPKNMMLLPPLKDSFADYFMIGNIFNPNSDVSAAGAASITNQRLTRHYSILTPENNMKPSYLSTAATTVNTNNMNTAIRMISAAEASGIKVVGHTLLWHSQNANWMNSLSTDKNTAITTMKNYITTIMGYAGIKGKIYSWDILNEVFPDGVSSTANWKTSMRTTGDSQAPNPWFVAIGSDFVFEGYKAAREADPAAILYYNDYNLDSVGKATMVHNMVRDVNDQWKTDPKYDNRLLIEGIGMQSHHNINVTAAQIKASLDLFRPLGVKISISELDVLSQSYNDFSSGPGSGPNKTGSATATAAGKTKAAELYGDYFKLFIQNADIIERVTFWGVYDEQSWRSGGLPLLFEGTPTSKAKPAYYKVIEALNP